MGINYSIDSHLEVIFEVWEGEITAGDLREFWTGYLADQEVMKCRRTLVDLRKADIKFHGAELEMLINTIVLPVLGDLKWKTALIIESSVQMGVSRQYNVFAGFYSKDAIFHDKESALFWLIKQ